MGIDAVVIGNHAGKVDQRIFDNTGVLAGNIVTLQACRVHDKGTQQGIGFIVTGQSKSSGTIETCQRDARSKAACFAQENVGGTDGNTVDLGPRRADDHVRKSVAVDVAVSRDRLASPVVCINTVHAKSTGAIERGNIGGTGEVGCPEDHVGGSRR